MSEFSQKDYKFYFKRILGPEDIITGLQPLVISPDGVEGPPSTMFGSAICQIISLIFRVILVSISENTPPFLILDEPFSHAGLSEDLRINLESFLFKLVKDSGIQLFIVSHIETLIGNVYEVNKINGISEAILVS